MSRLNKTIRTQMLTAIIADSKYTGLPLSEHEVITKHVHNIIKEVMTPKVIEAYKSLQEDAQALADVSSIGMTIGGIREVEKNSCVYVRYQLKSNNWKSSTNIHNLEVGTLVPTSIYMERYPKHHEAMLTELDNIKDIMLKRVSFTNKVMGLLMSVNTIKQLNTQLPQFVKYLPDTLTQPKVSKNKLDMKEVLSSLNK